MQQEFAVPFLKGTLKMILLNLKLNGKVPAKKYEENRGLPQSNSWFNPICTRLVHSYTISAEAFSRVGTSLDKKAIRSEFPRTRSRVKLHVLLSYLIAFMESFGLTCFNINSRMCHWWYYYKDCMRPSLGLGRNYLLAYIAIY